jgi:ABC-type phosphate/phosphonate transport system substrate-binding protein
VLFTESLVRARQGNGRIDLVIGKQSVVKSDAAELHWSLRPLAMLTGKDGATTLTGLFIVRNDDPAKTIADLKGYKVFFGPADSDEKHAAAIAALRAAGVAAPEKPETRPGCSDAALDVLQEQDPATGVISSYAMPLLEGCGTIQKGSLKVVGETGPVPFITVFAAESLDEAAGKQVLKALFSLAKDHALLKMMESKSGFVEMPVEMSLKAVPSAPAPEKKKLSR